MASTVQAPPPPPPIQPPPYRPRSVSGPIILISIGIVFLLGTMGYLRWSNLGHWFAHYWPLILIAAGVIKLVEYQNAQRHGVRTRGLGAGSIFLLILFVVAGLIATQASRFNWGNLRDEINIDDNDFSWFGQKYSFTDELGQDFPAGANLHVQNSRGAVNISASDDSRIHVAVHKRINAESQAEADKWNAGTKPQVNVSGNIVTLNANNDAAGDHGVSDDLDISVPRKAAVTVSTRHGDVSVLGREGDVQITAEHGDVSAEDITGKVALTLDHSSARISQVSSDVTIQGRADDVSIEDVKGAVHLDGEFMESVKLAKIAGAVSFRSSRTELEFAKLDGNLDLDSGDLQAADMMGPVRLTTRSKDIRLSNLSGDVRVQNENGSVELQLLKMGTVQVDNRKGDISVYVPDKAGFQLDARARNGDFESDFDSLKVDNSHDTSTAAGAIGSGGPRIVLNNEHGDIEIRKRSSMAEAPEPPTPPAASKSQHAPHAPPAPPAVTEN